MNPSAQEGSGLEGTTLVCFITRKHHASFDQFDQTPIARGLLLSHMTKNKAQETQPSPQSCYLWLWQLTFKGESDPGRGLQGQASPNTQQQQQQGEESGRSHGHAGGPQGSKSGRKKRAKKVLLQPMSHEERGE